MTRNDFITIVEQTQGAFRRFLTALCGGDSFQADDIAQEAFLKAYLACDDLSADSKFKPWLYRIGYTTFINHQRSKSKHSSTSSIDAVADVIATDSSDDAFRYQELHEALVKLSEKERSAVLLFYLEDYSTKEIAEIMETSNVAIRQLLTRGRKHLCEFLKQID